MAARAQKRNDRKSSVRLSRRRSSEDTSDGHRTVSGHTGRSNALGSDSWCDGAIEPLRCWTGGGDSTIVSHLPGLSTSAHHQRNEHFRSHVVGWDDNAHKRHFAASSTAQVGSMNYLSRWAIFNSSQKLQVGLESTERHANTRKLEFERRRRSNGLAGPKLSSATTEVKKQCVGDERDLLRRWLSAIGRAALVWNGERSRKSNSNEHLHTGSGTVDDLL